MSNEFRKPGYDQEVAPERNLVKGMKETVAREQALATAMLDTQAKIEAGAEVIKAMEDALADQRLPEVEREQLEQLLARHDVALALLEEEHERLLRAVVEAEETLEQINQLHHRFTSRGGQA